MVDGTIAPSRAFDAAERREIRERAIFEAGKLDPQTYDECTLAPFALRISPGVWRTLAATAERCAAELARVEAELVRGRSHWRALGLSRRMRAVLAGVHQPSSRDPRFCRFDFHPTADGWCVSEINADVPGGFIEAGALTRIVAELLPGCECPPDPARALAEAIAARAGGGDVALVHATAYTDDQQVMVRIGEELRMLGVRAHLAAPNHVVLAGHGGCALSTNGARITAIARFFPAEWIANLPRADRMRWCEIDARVPQANPLSALLIQPKRLPLVLPSLGIELPTWMSVLAPSRAIGWRRLAPSLVPDGFVLKPTWGRIGEGVCIAGVTEPRIVRRAQWAARAFPSEWMLQRRFESQPIDGATLHACLGVYVIDGRAAGVYARVAPRALIDGRSQDAAVVIDPSLDLSRDALAARPTVMLEQRHVTV
jgi:glutathionylspermidine synthase